MPFGVVPSAPRAHRAAWRCIPARGCWCSKWSQVAFLTFVHWVAATVEAGEGLRPAPEPLHMAVIGPGGSGKSFAQRAMAKFCEFWLGDGSARRHAYMNKTAYRMGG